MRRLEAQLGVRLLNRTTRSVAPTEAGARLLERLGPALGEVEAALDVVNGFRDRPAGTLRLNVPVSAARLVLPAIVPPFLAAYPEIRLEVIAEESFVDVLAAGCDAGIRYDERLEQDMIAVPIGPRVQRFAAAAAPAYLDRRGRPEHPRDLLDHACLRGRFASGAIDAWEFERDGEVVHGRSRRAAAGERRRRAPIWRSMRRSPASAIICLFEDWLRPHLESGALEPVLEPWWQPLFRARSSTTPGGAWFRRRCVPSSISSRLGEAQRRMARDSCSRQVCPTVVGTVLTVDGSIAKVVAMVFSTIIRIELFVVVPNT